MIYLDNAATTFPKPRTVPQAMQTAVLRFGANPGRSGHRLSLQAAEAMYRCREAAAGFFHCESPECIAFTLNCTYGINMVLKGILKEGDHVLCSDLEHNAVMRPLYALQKKGFITYTTVPVTEGDNDAVVEAFRRGLRKNTALVITTHASNVTGVRLPLERIAALCKLYGIPMAADCAQSAGVLPIDVTESGIDYLCAPGHKGLYGPMGTGLVVCRNGEQLRTILEGGTGTASVELQQPLEMPEHLEPGTQNLPGICGLGAGIRFVAQKTPRRIFRHELQLMQQLYDGLKKIDGIRFYTERPTEQYHVPVLSFNLGEIDSEIVGQYLNQAGIAVRAGLHCAPAAHRKIGTLSQGTVRVCPSVFTGKEEIGKFIKTVAAAAKKLQNRF